MWGVIFVSGILVFLVLGFASGLYRFKGTELKMRIYYGLCVILFYTLFLTLFSIFEIGGKIQIIGKDFLFGVVLSVPLCFIEIKGIKKKIKGATIYYRRNQYIQDIFFVLLPILLFNILILDGLRRQIVMFWGPFVSISFAVLFTELFTLFYVINLERKLGRPLLEDKI